MVKPTNTAIMALVVFLLITSIYYGYWAVITTSAIWLGVAVYMLVTAYGLFVGKRWGQYCWFALALTVSVQWIVIVARLALSGWPYDNAFESFLSLVPGLLLLLVCGLGSLSVYKRYKPQRDAR